MVKGKGKSDLRRLRLAEAEARRAEGVDSDSTDLSDDDSTIIKAEQKRHGGADDKDLDYAPLFGNPKFTWHTKIPFLRRLWEYRTYRLAELENLNAGLEDLDWDYPL